MSGLREALEDMCLKADRRDARRREQGLGPIPARVGVEAIRALLADHPAEPTPVVSREAAARAIEQAASEVDLAKYFLPGMTDRFVDALLSAGAFRAEAEVRKQVAEEIAEAILATEMHPGDRDLVLITLGSAAKFVRETGAAS